MIDLIKFDVNNDFFQTTQLKLKTNAWWKYQYFSIDIVTPQIICKYAWVFFGPCKFILERKTLPLTFLSLLI